MQSNDNDLSDEGPSEYELEASASASGHLMRVRVRKVVWDQLRILAEDEAERLGRHVTASDIVRAAIGNYLGLHESLATLRNLPPASLGDQELVFDGVA